MSQLKMSEKAQIALGTVRTRKHQAQLFTSKLVRVDEQNLVLEKLRVLGFENGLEGLTERHADTNQDSIYLQARRSDDLPTVVVRIDENLGCEVVSGGVVDGEAVLLGARDFGAILSTADTDVVIASEFSSAYAIRAITDKPVFFALNEDNLLQVRFQLGRRLGSSSVIVAGKVSDRVRRVLQEHQVKVVAPKSNINFLSCLHSRASVESVVSDFLSLGIEELDALRRRILEARKKVKDRELRKDEELRKKRKDEELRRAEELRKKKRGAERPRKKTGVRFL